MKRKVKQGVTLIELIIVLSLIGVITAIVFTFFFSNKRTLNTVEIKSDLQYEAKKIMETIGKYAMEAKKVEFVNIGDTDNVDNIVFHLVPDDSTSEELAVFDVVRGSVNLVTLDDSDTIIKQFNDVATNVEAIKVLEMTEKSINLEVNFIKEDVKYSIKDNFYLRNK